MLARAEELSDWADVVDVILKLATPRTSVSIEEISSSAALMMKLISLLSRLTSDRSLYTEL
jgi:hypothetical protein